MIIALAGRRIDDEDADNKRFPLAAVPSVREKLRKFFMQNNVTHVVSSGACGSDLLAQEVAEDMGVTRTIVLPFDSGLFRKTSVTDRPGDWGKLYDRLVKGLTNQLVNLNYRQDDPRAYEKTNFEILNRIEHLSGRDDKIDIAVLVVWEGMPKDSEDMTFGLLAEAKMRSIRTSEINTLI